MTAFQPKLTITNAITRDLTQIERARGFLDAATLSGEWIERMSQRALLLEAHHTTHIEGTRLTLDQSERLLAGEDVPGADPEDARELLNYRDAFEFVSSYLNDGNPMTEGLIREIHKHLVADVRGGSASPGQYRTVQNYVVNSATGQTIYTPPPPVDVPPRMQQLVDWLNASTEIHPVLIAGIAQFQLVHIHPFVDGNGRTSRLLSTLCLYRTGYDFKRLFTISEYYDRDRPAFYAAIQGVRHADMELTVWLEYFASGLATQIQETVDRGELVIKVDLLAQKHPLNERQVAAVTHLTEHEYIDIERLEVLCPGITRRSLQRDLKALVDKGILHSRGDARATRYSLLSLDF